MLTNGSTARDVRDTSAIARSAREQERHAVLVVGDAHVAAGRPAGAALQAGQLRGERAHQAPVGADQAEVQRGVREPRGTSAARDAANAPALLRSPGCGRLRQRPRGARNDDLRARCPAGADDRNRWTKRAETPGGSDSSGPSHAGVRSAAAATTASSWERWPGTPPPRRNHSATGNGRRLRETQTALCGSGKQCGEQSLCVIQGRLAPLAAMAPGDVENSRSSLSAASTCRYEPCRIAPPARARQRHRFAARCARS